MSSAWTLLVVLVAFMAFVAMSNGYVRIWQISEINYEFYNKLLRTLSPLHKITVNFCSYDSRMVMMLLTAKEKKQGMNAHHL